MNIVRYLHLYRVAPRAGAWIEITDHSRALSAMLVAPRAGAWIEMTVNDFLELFSICRTPCGCVD